MEKIEWIKSTAAWGVRALKYQVFFVVEILRWKYILSFIGGWGIKIVLSFFVFLLLLHFFSLTHGGRSSWNIFFCSVFFLIWKNACFFYDVCIYGLWWWCVWWWGWWAIIKSFHMCLQLCARGNFDILVVFMFFCLMLMIIMLLIFCLLQLQFCVVCFFCCLFDLWWGLLLFCFVCCCFVVFLTRDEEITFLRFVVVFDLCNFDWCSFFEAT